MKNLIAGFVLATSSLASAEQVQSESIHFERVDRGDSLSSEKEIAEHVGVLSPTKFYSVFRLASDFLEVKECSIIPGLIDDLTQKINSEKSDAKRETLRSYQAQLEDADLNCRGVLEIYPN